MKKSKQPRLMSYAEYRLREAYDESGEWQDEDGKEDDWSFDDPAPIDSEIYPIEPGLGVVGNGQEDLDMLGMERRPVFSSMPEGGNELAQAAGPGPDEDPEDWQAKKDIEEVAGVYGLKLGSTKSGKLVVQGNRSQWRQDFPDYASAMQWVKANMDKVGKR